MGDLLDIARRAREEQRQRTKGTGNEGHAEPAARLRLSEFARAGLARSVRVGALGGAVVCLASDNTPLDMDARGLFRGQVVYRACEWLELYRQRARGELDDGTLRLIHEIKEVFGGELLPRDEAALSDTTPMTGIGH